MIIKNDKEILLVKMDTKDKEMRETLRNFITEGRNLSYLSDMDNNVYIKDTLAAEYYVELINTYKETKSLDNVALVMHAYKADPSLFAQIEFEKAFVLEKHNDITMKYLARKTGYNLKDKKEKLCFLSNILKIAKVEKQYLMDHSTEEKKNRVLEMTKQFHSLYENVMLFPNEKIYTK